MKNIRVFISENFQFWVVKFSMYLNRRVFVMILQILSPKNENFQMKNSDYFHVSAQRGDSNVYPQSMFDQK